MDTDLVIVAIGSGANPLLTKETDGLLKAFNGLCRPEVHDSVEFASLTRIAKEGFKKQCFSTSGLTSNRALGSVTP